MATTLKEVVTFLDASLHVGEIPDDPNALNGLQLEAGEDIRSVACAVDACEAAIDEASRRGAQLLLVHHGLLWGGNRRLSGPMARKLARCFNSGLSVYSAHLPLDLHHEWGNNIGLLRALDLAPDGGFARFEGVDIGLTAPCDLAVDELRDRVTRAVGPCRMAGAGPSRVRRLAVVTGSAGTYAAAAARAGIDALVTGEGPHYTALEAEERGVHLVLAGHYRTETFGVKSLGAVLAGRFGVEWSFIEHDTGL